jgi:O-antigen ligase
MLKFLFGVVLVGGGFACALFVEPVWGLYLFAVLSHIRLGQLGESYPLPLRVPIVIGVLTLLLYVLSGSYRWKFYKWPLEVWLFGLMVAGMAISSSRAIFHPEIAWDITFDYFKYWIFFVMLIQMIDTRKRLDGFYWVLVLSSAWLVYRAWDLRGTTGDRFENIGGGNIEDSNHYAAALVMLFPFVYHRTLTCGRTAASFAAILCFGIVMSIVIANSRGGFIGLMALSVLILLFLKEGRTRNILLIVTLILLVLSFAKENQIDRLAGVFDAGHAELRDNSENMRIQNWTLAYQLFLEHPLTGIGPGNFVYYSGERVEGLGYGVAGHVTHSLWFEMLSAGGLLVCVPFVIMLVRVFYSSQRLAREYMRAGNREIALYIYIPMFALGGFLTASTFIDRMVYEPIYWCIGLGAVHRYLWGQAPTMISQVRAAARPSPVMVGALSGGSSNVRHCRNH